MPGEALASRAQQPPLSLDPPALARLRQRIEKAAKRGKGEPLLVSATSRIERPESLSDLLRGAVVVGEPWALIEQPDRERRGLLALGAAANLRIDPDRPSRLGHVADRWQHLASKALADAPGGVPGSGLTLIGGMAFQPHGGRGAAWRGFGDGDLIIPAVSIAVVDDEATLTATVLVKPGDDPAAVHARAELSTALLVPRSPDPADPFIVAPQVRSVLAASHFTEAVARAVRRIDDGEFQKIVLAREIDVHSTQPWDVPHVLHRLAERFPACFVFGVGRGDGAMIGASPELLLRRDGQRVETVALAGTSRRSDDPSVDEHLAAQLLESAKDRAEHDLVVQRIRRTLGPHALWVTAAEAPQVVTVKNVHHLATPIRAQLDGRARLLDLVDAMHPTPAVGGEPAIAAQHAIPELEGMDRGWYAAPIGWIDRAGDGEFFVGLRSGMLRGAHARLFAGVGIVADSDPSSELAETESKLGAVLGALRPGD